MRFQPEEGEKHRVEDRGDRLGGSDLVGKGPDGVASLEMDATPE
jgi:hypothetical protein